MTGLDRMRELAGQVPPKRDPRVEAYLTLHVPGTVYQAHQARPGDVVIHDGRAYGEEIVEAVTWVRRDGNVSEVLLRTPKRELVFDLTDPVTLRVRPKSGAAGAALIKVLGVLPDIEQMDAGQPRAEVVEAERLRRAREGEE